MELLKVSSSFSDILPVYPIICEKYRASLYFLIVSSAMATPRSESLFSIMEATLSSLTPVAITVGIYF